MAIFQIDNHGKQQMQILDEDIDAFFDLLYTGELKLSEKESWDKIIVKRIDDYLGSRRYLVNFQKRGDSDFVSKTKVRRH